MRTLFDREAFKTDDPLLDDCYRYMRRVGARYMTLTFDLIRTPYVLSGEGSIAVGDMCSEYLDSWVERARRKECPFPRRGVGYSVRPTERVTLTILREDSDMPAKLWNALCENVTKRYHD